MITTKRSYPILQYLWNLLPDRCQICRVSFWRRLRGHGCPRGNENIIDGVRSTHFGFPDEGIVVNGVRMCDDCHAKHLKHGQEIAP